jgi:hypothetical protein
MNFDELYKMLGYGLVCLLVFYVAAKSIRFQLGVIEGLMGIKKKTDTAEAQDQAQAQDEDDDEDEDQAHGESSDDDAE